MTALVARSLLSHLMSHLPVRCGLWALTLNLGGTKSAENVQKASHARGRAFRHGSHGLFHVERLDSARERGRKSPLKVATTALDRWDNCSSASSYRFS